MKLIEQILIMNIIPYLLILLSTIISASVLSQEDTLTAKEFRALKREMAVTQIRELKEGVLLIQLKTSQNTIDAYIKKGNLKKANFIKARQDQDNKSIIKGFRDYFNFCPVYFCYSTDRNNLKNKDYSKITFLDDDLKPIVIPLNLTEVNYYISGIAKNNYNNTTLDNISNFKTDYDNSIQFDAFIINNKNFQQLSAPFPYYAKTHHAVKVNDKKRWESIKKLNYRLHTFHKNNL